MKKLMLVFHNISKIVLRPKDRVLYPKKGIHEISQRLWELYSQQGGETLFNTEAIGLRKSNSSITSVITLDKDGHEHDIPVKNLIWTGSVRQLCNLLTIDAKLDYVSCALVFVILKRKLSKRIKALYTYYVQTDIIFNRLYYPSYLCKQLTPEGRDALCAEITLKKDWECLGGNTIIERVRSDLEKLGLIRQGDVEAMEYVEIRDAYPVYPVDYREQISKIFYQLLYYKNLYPIGRMGSFYFSMMPDVIELGEETAKHILSADG
jgi:protoporphyrinogen oxidase